MHSSTVPALLIGGWQDWFLEQTLYQYAALRDRGVDVGLTVGPWAHLGIDPGVTTPESLAWLTTHLPVDGAPPAPPRPARVRVYVTGARTWRTMPDWPPPTTDRTWYLAPDGRLADDAPAEPGATTFRYDPMDPTPSVGGRILARSAGQRDNTELEARDDVVTFTTGPLRKPVELLGGARVRLFVESDNPYADVFVRLCDVEPNGRSVNITDRLVRLDPAPGEQPATGERTVETTLPDTAHRFRAGHRIRLQVSGGAHPRYARNLGTGEPPGPRHHGRAGDPPDLLRRRVAVVGHPAGRLILATRRSVEKSTSRPRLPPSHHPPATPRRVPHRERSASYGGVMAKHYVDETAEFVMPLSGRHSADDTGALEMTQRFDPGFSRRRPALPAVPPRDDQTADRPLSPNG